MYDDDSDDDDHHHHHKNHNKPFVCDAKIAYDPCQYFDALGSVSLLHKLKELRSCASCHQCIFLPSSCPSFTPRAFAKSKNGLGTVGLDCYKLELKV